MQSLLLPFLPPDLNTLIAAKSVVYAHGRGSFRGNRYNTLKQQFGKRVAAIATAARLQRVATGQHFVAVWHAPNRRKDPDNIAGGGRKIILDALVDIGVLPDDSWRWVLSWVDLFALDPAGEGACVLAFDETPLPLDGIRAIVPPDEPAHPKTPTGLHHGRVRCQPPAASTRRQVREAARPPVARGHRRRRPVRS